MSQNREKEETLDLKLSSTTTTLCPPENCKLSAPTTTTAQICAASGSGSGSTSPDSARSDPAVIHTPTDPDTPAAESPDPVPAKKAVNRCLCCAKRVGLTGFRCRCGELFCSVHRYSDRHDCCYDYKAAGRDAIARENPVVRAAKILKV